MILLDFYGEWCSPCKSLMKLIDLVTPGMSLEVKKVDISVETDLALQYGVRAVPTLVLLDDGKVVGKHVGAMTKEQLLDFLKNKNES